MSQQRTREVELMDVDDLRLVETPTPLVSESHAAQRDKVWDAALQANPCGLFDGPVIASAGLAWEASGIAVLSWAAVTYRHFALRRVPGATPLPSIFVAVAQPTDDAGLLVGRMGATTAAPDRLQLPGGSVEPPPHGARLNTTTLARHASRELLEETGLHVPHDLLTLWTLSRGEHGNIGVFFLAPSIAEEAIHDLFTRHLTTEALHGRDPELREITILRTADDLRDTPGPVVDYLAPILDLHLATITTPAR